MSYNDEELAEEQSFKASDDEGGFGDDADEPLEPLEGIGGFEYEDEDPDKDH